MTQLLLISTHEFTISRYYLISACKNESHYDSTAKVSERLAHYFVSPPDLLCLLTKWN